MRTIVSFVASSGGGGGFSGRGVGVVAADARGSIARGGAAVGATARDVAIGRASTGVGAGSRDRHVATSDAISATTTAAATIVRVRPASSRIAAS
jgi:hypothetical protein